jgi:hypothetical protein
MPECVIHDRKSVGQAVVLYLPLGTDFSYDPNRQIHNKLDTGTFANTDQGVSSRDAGESRFPFCTTSRWTLDCNVSCNASAVPGECRIANFGNFIENKH